VEAAASGVGASLTDPVTLAPVDRTAMLICAGLMAAGALVAPATVPSSFAAVRAEVAAFGAPVAAPVESPCRVHCAVGGAPPQPTPRPQQAFSSAREVCRCVR